MEKRTLSVPNISCGHCVMTIQNELRDLVGIKQVDGDSQNKAITVGWEPPTTLQEILDTLKEINYPAS